MVKTIKVELSENGIREAINALESYQNDLKQKVEVFVDKLAKIGVNVINAVMRGVPEEEQAGAWNVTVNQNKKGDVISATISLSGDRVLFIEFGAGIRYASPEHPMSQELGYGAGTYPGQTHVPIPGYWFYTDEAGEKHKSYGNRAYMPVYHASEALILEISSIAKEVFN